jgi:hypothetical protein
MFYARLKFNSSFVLVISFLLSSCSAGIKSIPVNYVPSEKNKNEAVAILKVTPNAKAFDSNELVFRRMGLKGNTVYFRALSADDESSSSITPTAGYYVFSVEVSGKNEAHAISVLKENQKDNSNEKRVGYTPGCAGYALGFQITQPGVYYLGDLTYGENITSIGELKFDYSVETNLPDVKRYLTVNYPSLSNTQLKHKELQKYWFNASCQAATIYIAI